MGAGGTAVQAFASSWSLNHPESMIQEGNLDVNKSRDNMEFTRTNTDRLEHTAVTH